LIQGQNWATNSVPFIETVRSMQPYFLLRLIGGLMAGAGVLCFAYNVWMTARQPALAAIPSPAPVIAPSGGSE